MEVQEPDQFGRRPSFVVRQYFLQAVECRNQVLQSLRLLGADLEKLLAPHEEFHYHHLP